MEISKGAAAAIIAGVVAVFGVLAAFKFMHHAGAAGTGRPPAAMEARISNMKMHMQDAKNHPGPGSGPGMSGNMRMPPNMRSRPDMQPH